MPGLDVFECLLHISYNYILKSGLRQFKIIKFCKTRIQGVFRKELGLFVDFVEQGVGTITDGNSARFFSNPTIAAKITGLNENLIRRFAVILQAIDSGQPIHAIKFGI